MRSSHREKDKLANKKSKSYKIFTEFMKFHFLQTKKKCKEVRNGKEDNMN